MLRLCRVPHPRRYPRIFVRDWKPRDLICWRCFVLWIGWTWHLLRYPSSLSGTCLSWMPIMWKRCGHWISHLIASTCIPCCTIPWPLLSNCPRLAPDSATLFHHVLTPPSVPWRRNFVIDSTQRKPTAWSPAAIPKTVKHPLAPPGSTNSVPICYYFQGSHLRREYCRVLVILY